MAPQQHAQSAPMQSGYMPQASDLGFYAEQVVLPPTQAAAGYSLHVPAEGEAFNYSYVAKCVDGSHAVRVQMPNHQADLSCSTHTALVLYRRSDGRRMVAASVVVRISAQ